MKMRPVAGGIELPAGQTVELKPGSLHVMLFDLKQPLKEGDSFPLTLAFEKEGAREVTVRVEKIGAMSAGGSRTAGVHEHGGHHADDQPHDHGHDHAGSPSPSARPGS